MLTGDLIIKKSQYIPNMSSVNQKIEVFFSYSHQDQELRDELAKHLKNLQKQGVISTWCDRDISAGSEWAGAIDDHLNSAQIILLLISPDFMASDYCCDLEMRRAMERYEDGEAVVIPIILRPVDWTGAVFGKLQGLPKNVQPVTTWANRDQAFLDITQGIRLTIKEIKNKQIFDSCNFKTLINILHKINQNNLVITSYNNYQETHNDNQKKILQQNKHYLSINQQLEYLIINELLILMDSEISEAGLVADVIKKPNDSLVLGDFVENFLIKILTIQEIDNALKKDLKEWIENNYSEASIEVNFEDKSVNNFIDYLFIVIRSSSNKQRFVLEKAEFVEFYKNQKKIKETPINLDKNHINDQGYLEKEIPDIIDELIKKMYDCVEPRTLPVIELFLPINLLIKDFDIQKITNEWGEKNLSVCYILLRCVLMKDVLYAVDQKLSGQNNGKILKKLSILLIIIKN